MTLEQIEKQIEELKQKKKEEIKKQKQKELKELREKNAKKKKIIKQNHVYYWWLCYKK